MPGRLTEDGAGDGISVQQSLTLARAVLTYGTVIATDTSRGNHFTITVTDGVAFTISAPISAAAGKQITYTIRNTSGGAHGAITWNAVFKMVALGAIATANSRSITFVFDGTNWVELFKSPADIPN